MPWFTLSSVQWLKWNRLTSTMAIHIFYSLNNTKYATLNKLRKPVPKSYDYFSWDRSPHQLWVITMPTRTIKSKHNIDRVMDTIMNVARECAIFGLLLWIFFSSSFITSSCRQTGSSMATTMTWRIRTSVTIVVHEHMGPIACLGQNYAGWVQIEDRRKRPK
jgi:hypothetical protein